MAKFLYITPPIGDPPVGGRALLSHLHCTSLASLLGEDFILHELGPNPVSGIGRVAGAMGGAIDGVSVSSIADVLARIHGEGVDRAFLNGSNLGGIEVGPPCLRMPLSELGRPLAAVDKSGAHRAARS